MTEDIEKRFGRKEKYYNEIKYLAEMRNIELLSKTYSNNTSPLKFLCNVCQRTWTDYRVHIKQKVQRNTFGCPSCNGKKTKEELYKEFQALAQKRGGGLLSPRFYGMTKEHLWYCNKHQFEWCAKPNNIKDHPSKKGTWCPKCKIEKLPQNQLKYTIEDMQKLAESKAGGGKLLSKEFHGVAKYHLWECGTCRHVWKAKPHEIMGKSTRPEGTWCPNCAKGRAEKICKAFFEELFGIPFETETNLEWLKIYGLHLDGYNSNLKIAFERHGIQHYRFHPFYHNNDPKEFERQLMTDFYKRRMCKIHGIILIEVGYERRNGKLHKITINEMEACIRKKCDEKGISIPKRKNKIDWTKFKLSEPNKVNELQELAEKRDGKLLSAHYYGELIKLKWYCNKHNRTWDAFQMI